MSDIKHIGAMTLGIIGESLLDRNEKIKEILESDTPGSYTSDFGKLLVITPPGVDLTYEDSIKLELENL